MTQLLTWFIPSVSSSLSSLWSLSLVSSLLQHSSMLSLWTMVVFRVKQAIKQRGYHGVSAGSNLPSSMLLPKYDRLWVQNMRKHWPKCKTTILMVIMVVHKLPGHGRFIVVHYFVIIVAGDVFIGCHCAFVLIFLAGTIMCHLFDLQLNSSLMLDVVSPFLVEQTATVCYISFRWVGKGQL